VAAVSKTEIKVWAYKQGKRWNGWEVKRIVLFKSWENQLEDLGVGGGLDFKRNSAGGHWLDWWLGTGTSNTLMTLEWTFSGSMNCWEFFD
jgi:hypothetical protein